MPIVEITPVNARLNRKTLAGNVRIGPSAKLQTAASWNTLRGMVVAFKEWAVVVDALGQGTQVVILRKGGISEGRGGFHVEHPEFLLMPTLFHQQRECVIPSAQLRYDEIAPTLPPPERFVIEYFCKVVSWQKLETLADAQRLSGQHIWRDEVIAERFDWGKQKAIYALAVRVYRLPQSISFEMTADYGGCKSWINLSQEVPINQATPVLSDDQFAMKLTQFEEALRPEAIIE